MRRLHTFARLLTGKKSTAATPGADAVGTNSFHAGNSILHRSSCGTSADSGPAIEFGASKWQKQRARGEDAYLDIGASADQSLRELYSRVSAAVQSEPVQRRIVVGEHDGCVGAGLQQALELFQVVGLDNRVQRRTVRSKTRSVKSAVPSCACPNREEAKYNRLLMSDGGCAMRSNGHATTHAPQSIGHGFQTSTLICPHTAYSAGICFMCPQQAQAHDNCRNYRS